PSCSGRCVRFVVVGERSVDPIGFPGRSITSNLTTLIIGREEPKPVNKPPVRPSLSKGSLGRVTISDSLYAAGRIDTSDNPLDGARMIRYRVFLANDRRLGVLRHNTPLA